MDVDFAFLADTAQEGGGKLHALGIGIDTLFATDVPVAMAAIAAVTQVRYSVAEVGTKTLAIRVVDADGGNVIPPIDSEVAFAVPPGSTVATARLIVALNGLTFPRYGDYAIHVAIDGHDVASLRLAVAPQPNATG